MTDQEKGSVNKLLCEWMGIKYHAHAGTDGEHLFCICGHSTHSLANHNQHLKLATNYFPPSPDFWDLWERARKDQNWGLFLFNHERKILKLNYDWGPSFHRDLLIKMFTLIGPAFPKAWAQFLGWKGES